MRAGKRRAEEGEAEEGGGEERGTHGRLEAGDDCVPMARPGGVASVRQTLRLTSATNASM